jgi:hypothetical protein
MAPGIKARIFNIKKKKKVGDIAQFQFFLNLLCQNTLKSFSGEKNKTIDRLCVCVCLNAETFWFLLNLISNPIIEFTVVYTVIKHLLGIRTHFWFK